MRGKEFHVNNNHHENKQKVGDRRTVLSMSLFHLPHHDQRHSSSHLQKNVLTPSIVISGASFDEESDGVSVTRRRFLILCLFALFSASNAFQWIQYSIITNVISDYYHVSNLAVNWTSVIFMAIYIPGILPASWLLNQKGLRFCVLFGGFLNASGAWIKCFSVSPDRFLVTMAGQSIAASAQLFVLNLPPRIAAVWFGPKEISSATSFGVFGNQIGIALGFILPPLLFSGNEFADPRITERGLNIMFSAVALLTTVLLLVMIFLFQDRPSHPPSLAQALADQRLVATGSSHASIIQNLVTDRNFVLLFITYGLNVGVFYAISTILNQLIQLRFPGHEVDAGIMGLILTLAGVVGSVACGLILDSTHAFKSTTLIVYALSLMGMTCFSLALQLPVIWPLFLVSGIMGFFMTGYLPVGFEFAAELSYPNPEGASAGLLNGAAQICGVVFTFASSSIVDSYGDIPACVLLTTALAVGTLLTSLVRGELKRQAASKKPEHTIGLSPRL